MISEERKLELRDKIKYNPKNKPHKLLKFIRSFPLIYSQICKIRRYLSRELKNRNAKKIFQLNKEIFQLNDFESKHINELRKNGFTVLDCYFDEELINSIDKQADKLFKSLKIDDNGYHINHGRIRSKFDYTYEELSVFDHNITIKEPLTNIENMENIVFDKSILKIVSNYLGYIPIHTPIVMRNFPQDIPIESSNFHKDSDEHDVIQVFVHLIDVDGQKGPLVYVPNSHRHDRKSCIPRTDYDLGKMNNYGRVSDTQVDKIYPKITWVPLKAKLGTVAIADVNGFHKGPCWDNFKDPNNKFRDTIRINLRGGSFQSKRELKIDVKKYNTVEEIFKTQHKEISNENNSKEVFS